MSNLEQHKNRLKNAGYKLTNARLCVLQAIDNLGGHCTSGEVLEKVAGVDESIGRAIVFRTLELLTQLGIIRPTYMESSMTPQYVMLPNGHHHHVICTNCNRVIEFEDCGLSGLAAALEKQFKLVITGHLLEFYAICENCRALPVVDKGD
jgi:Fur family transcriptional regulator, ferric uptake regulator